MTTNTIAEPTSEPLRVRDLTCWLERFAPLSLAEDWDNVGLLMGDPDAPVTRVMTCLTVTPQTAAEAIADQIDLIVSHHPILFRGIKRLRADRGDTGFLWTLARAGVAVYSPHTAFDNCPGGINDELAQRLGLNDVRPLRPPAATEQFKLVVFTPESDLEPVRRAAAQAGAGVIGDYTFCSFELRGRGTFLGGDATNPTIGQAGRLETVEEVRLEMVCPPERVDEVVRAVIQAHSYEEPAYDLVKLHTPGRGPGVGRIGTLDESHTLESLAAHVARVLGLPKVELAGDPTRPARTLAIMCGAGDDVLGDARRAGADALLTGEARFHRGLEAFQEGIGLILAGHYATERPGVERLAARLSEAFPTLRVHAARRERDPFQSVAARPRTA
ncbi:protein of unknown function DUF34 [Isosphaera pallida ATCC 43644]|uniref:GTP cyclohydrolase 1 type 2 homolog n=1 Tax=Isosphaera pallida (strain ATCC 43644 / DSM 9630 / IS1B) TaxID=575540 RepID=E8R1J1_ISOPI|nr:Nif3-like dinuclear metal center hexameric protein [Isosphaera pallida]ADV63409.1 protein of unknown function DUF34 [Isosphaera pallida ATCC 43644]